MMKRSFILLTVILLLPGTLTAQDEGRPQMLFNSGLTMQMGPDDFKDQWYPGINFGLGLDIYLTYKWDLNLSFEYNKFFLKKDEFKSAYSYDSDIIVHGNGVSVLTVSLNGKYILVEEGSNIPYLIVGLGLFKSSREQMEIYEGHKSIETRFSYASYSLGFNTGIGIELPIHMRFHLFGELKYHIGFTDDLTQLIPIRMGVKFK